MRSDVLQLLQIKLRAHSLIILALIDLADSIKHGFIIYFVSCQLGLSLAFASLEGLTSLWLKLEALLGHRKFNEQGVLVTHIDRLSQIAATVSLLLTLIVLG